jgi:5-methylthioadenosine/S-adenosylhomocysteine deaminase
VPIVLGSDYAPDTVSTPFETVRAALMLQRDLAASDDALTMEHALRMATQAGPSLGRPGQLGHVAVGQVADLVLLDTTGLHHLGSDHPVPALALRARSSDVSTVIVDGRVVVEHGKLIDIDEAALASRARHALATLASHS